MPIPGRQLFTPSRTSISLDAATYAMGQGELYSGSIAGVALTQGVPVNIALGGDGAAAFWLNRIAVDVRAAAATLQVFRMAAVDPASGTPMHKTNSSDYYMPATGGPTVLVDPTITTPGVGGPVFELLPDEKTSGKFQAPLRWSDTNLLIRHDWAFILQVVNTDNTAGTLQALFSGAMTVPPT